MTKITILGDVEPNAIKQLEDCATASGAPFAAQMADGHLGYGLSIGGVLGLPDHVSPDGVGYDIGCGNKAVRTSIRVDDIVSGTGGAPSGTPSTRADEPLTGTHKNEASPHAYSTSTRQGAIARIMDEIVRRVDFGIGSRPGNVADHPVLEEIERSSLQPQREKADVARKQLGTVGGGNHYVDLFSDEDGWLWVGVHFGSRGFGHSTASEYLRRTQEYDTAISESLGAKESLSPIALIPTSSELGQHYIEAMRLAGAYAYAGRDIVVERVLDILGATALEDIHNHHNYAWQETHGGQSLWVIRKGATPAFPGQKGFVGATMGEPSVILEGVESELGPDLLYSTVHGAGRVMSRSEAAGKSRWRLSCCNRDCDWTAPKGFQKPADGKCPKCGHPKLVKRPIKDTAGGKIDWAANLADLAAKGIELRGAAADEAPLAYKRLDDVLDYHASTIRILHTLTPLGVAMAGPGIKADD